MELIGIPHPGPDNLNAAPTEDIVVLRMGKSGEPELVTMRWWLTPYWAKEMSSRYAMFNAKSETAHKSPAFREPFRRRRCVVPVSGFYEWARANNQRLPYLFRPHETRGLLLAGLWDRWRNPDTGERHESFTVLTTDAAEAIRFVHDRQPVILSQEDALRWMSPDASDAELKGMLGASVPEALDLIPVTSYVNNARHKDARCVEPIGEPIAVAATVGGPQ